MNELPEHEIGRILAAAVPPLREPEDRLGEVRARVQRTRLRAGGAVLGAIVAVLAVAVPQLLVETDGAAPTVPPAAQLGPDDCPEVDDTRPSLTASEAERTGPMVRDGAVEVMRCEWTFDGEGGVLDERVLTAGADQLVAALNALPTREQHMASLEPEQREAWADGGIPCLAIRLAGWTSLVLLYPEGGTTTVYIDAACGTSAAGDGTVRFGDVLGEFDRLYDAQPVPEPPDVSDGLFQGNVLVLQTPEHGPRLCAAAWVVADVGGAEEAPPPCNAPANEIVGWDWEAVEAESFGGATWGFYFVVGTWDGERFTPTEPPRPQDPDLAAPHSVDEADLDHSACPEPSGGWRPVDPSTATDAAFEELSTWTSTVPEFAGMWLDQSYIDDLAPGEAGEEAANDPARFVLNMRFVGDPAQWEARVREIWGGALCVTAADRSQAELNEIQTSVDTERPFPQTLSSGQDVFANAVVVEVLVATPALQREHDERYGAGAVIVEGWLEPVT